MPFTKDILVTNSLIELFSTKDRIDLIARCEAVNIVFGDVIGNPHDHIQHVFFPLDSIISWLKIIDDNVALGVALIGSEGMLCVSPLLGVNITPCRAVVQKGGGALRIEVSSFMKLLINRAEMESILKRYIFVCFNQTMQTAACAHFHSIEQRLARTLLLLKDRAQSDSFHITQESLGTMLGVRRVGITKAAIVLHKKKLISYSRGELVIDNALELEAISCHCYQSDKEIYNQILKLKLID